MLDNLIALEECGANLKLRDSYGFNIYQIASQLKHQNIIDYLANKTVAKGAPALGIIINIEFFFKNIYFSLLNFKSKGNLYFFDDKRNFDMLTQLLDAANVYNYDIFSVKNSEQQYKERKLMTFGHYSLKHSECEDFKLREISNMHAYSNNTIYLCSSNFDIFDPFLENSRHFLVALCVQFSFSYFIPVLKKNPLSFLAGGAFTFTATYFVDLAYSMTKSLLTQDEYIKNHPKIEKFFYKLSFLSPYSKIDHTNETCNGLNNNIVHFRIEENKEFFICEKSYEVQLNQNDSSIDILSYYFGIF